MENCLSEAGADGRWIVDAGLFGRWFDRWKDGVFVPLEIMGLLERDPCNNGFT